MIRTVLGDVPADQLGVCHAHDHVLIGDGIGARVNPDLLVDDVDRAVDEVAAFRDAGGNALVDAMPLDSGRDPDGLVAVSRRTGVHVVATTGFHTAHYYARNHWSTRIPVETVVDLVCLEIEQGMDRHSYSGPVVERIDARAGVVKVATGPDGMDARARRMFDVAAACHLRTGAPVLTHTEHGALAIEHVDELTRRGVPADAVLVSHVDRCHDVRVHEQLATTGAYLVYDGPSRAKYHTPEQVAQLMVAACNAGAGHRVLVGLDLALRSYRTSYGGAPGLAFVLTRFVPVLRAAGFGDDDVDRVLRANPARALAMRERAR